MKRLILCSLAILMFHAFSFANFREGRLSVSPSLPYPLRVVINGFSYNLSRGQEAGILINSIPAGFYQVSIYRAGNSGRNGRYGSMSRSVYSGTVQVRPGYHLDITINRFGRVFLDEMFLGGFTGGNYQGMNDFRVVDRSVFEDMKRTLKGIAFEDTRVNTCKQMVSNHHFNADQVRDLLNLFSFEDNKLEIAKYCYRFTADPANYFRIYDAFSFNSSRDEMNRFLQNER